MDLVVAHALLGGGLLRGLFEEELQDMPRGQVGGQVIKGAMALALGAGAVGSAAGGEALDVRGAEQVGGDGELAQQRGFALTQRQGGSTAPTEYLRHCQG